MNGRGNESTVGTGEVEKRMPHSIRFLEPEWERIEAFAADRGLSPAEFVRYASLAAIEAPQDTLAGRLAPLIESTFRYVYVVATCKRLQMKEAGQGKQLEQVIGWARKAQVELLVPESD